MAWLFPLKRELQHLATLHIKMMLSIQYTSHSYNMFLCLASWRSFYQMLSKSLRTHMIHLVQPLQATKNGLKQLMVMEKKHATMWIPINTTLHVRGHRSISSSRLFSKLIKMVIMNTMKSASVALGIQDLCCQLMYSTWNHMMGQVHLILLPQVQSIS